jgi:hypothetical protein
MLASKKENFKKKNHPFKFKFEMSKDYKEPSVSKT